MTIKTYTVIATCIIFNSRNQPRLKTQRCEIDAIGAAHAAHIARVKIPRSIRIRVIAKKIMA